MVTRLFGFVPHVQSNIRTLFQCSQLHTHIIHIHNIHFNVDSLFNSSQPYTTVVVGSCCLCFSYRNERLKKMRCDANPVTRDITIHSNIVLKSPRFKLFLPRNIARSNVAFRLHLSQGNIVNVYWEGWWGSQSVELIAIPSISQRLPGQVQVPYYIYDSIL